MSSTNTMTLNLKIWRQKGREIEGKLVDYRVEKVSPDMSFLEMIDVLNEQLVRKGEDPIAFDHDCRDEVVRNVGVERVFPFHSPAVEAVKIITKGKSRRAKHNYLRTRTGKAARVAIDYNRD